MTKGFYLLAGTALALITTPTREFAQTVGEYGLSPAVASLRHESWKP